MGTARTFYDKWHQIPDLAFRQTITAGSDIQNWILRRNGWDTPEGLREYLSPMGRVLDAGCGNGRVTALLAEHLPPESEIVGIDLTAADVAAENLSGWPRATFAEGDLLGDLSGLGRFDFVYCQEVLHHTGDPAGAFANVATLLEPGGEIAIYVYRVKAPVREFTDDLVRDAMAEMPYDEAMSVSARIAEIGRQLAALDATITVPDVPELEIRAGEYDVQRFVYHHFFKCFWSDDFDPEGNASLNYDWYHPQDCTRHTLTEVCGWFADSELAVVHKFEDEYGITVRGRRKP